MRMEWTGHYRGFNLWGADGFWLAIADGKDASERIVLHSELPTIPVPLQGEPCGAIDRWYAEMTKS